MRVDFDMDGFITIGPECVLRVYKDVHSAPSCAAPPPTREAPRAAASFNHALQRTRSRGRGIAVAIVASLPVTLGVGGCAGSGRC